MNVLCSTILGNMPRISITPALFPNSNNNKGNRNQYAHVSFEVSSSNHCSLSTIASGWKPQTSVQLLIYRKFQVQPIRGLYGLYCVCAVSRPLVSLCSIDKTRQDNELHGRRFHHLYVRISNLYTLHCFLRLLHYPASYSKRLLLLDKKNIF